jgi:arylsulfatase A-like enzyme
VLLGAAASGAPGCDRTLDVAREVPERMRIEEVVWNLSAMFDRGAVVEEDARAPVSVRRLGPGFEWRAGGGDRQAIAAPPPSAVRYRATVPAGAVLRFGVGVEGPGRRDDRARALRFSVAVDGEELFSRVLNPAATRDDRRWVDGAVDLAAWADREVDIELRTAVAPGQGPPAGTPGWSHVRIVRERFGRRQQASAAAPNVLLLLVDTLRADRLGCYGAAPSPSPTLDGLATTGMVFEESIAQSAWTLPSVASLFTGLHPRSHGVVGVAADGAVPALAADEPRRSRDPSYLADVIPTLAERAQRAGVTTVGVSANPLVSVGTNLARGFETFVEFGLEGSPGTWRSADEINQAFLEWVERNGRFRFFAYLHYMDVHDPYAPPEAFRPAAPAGVRPRIARGEIHELARRIALGTGDAPTPAELDHLRDLYDAQIRHWDAALRSLLDGLAATGMRERTVIVVTSDHGEEFLEHGRLKHGTQLYEELVRVPLVLSGPGVRRRRARELVQGIDVFPTLAGLLGADAPGRLPGRNVLLPGAAAAAVSETRFGAGPDGRATELVALRTADWKLIHTAAADHYELYDLTRDPAERHNLYGGDPAGGALLRELQAWAAAAPTPPDARGSDPDLREKLRMLGYLEETPEEIGEAPPPGAEAFTTGRPTSGTGRGPRDPWLPPSIE